MTTSEWVNGKGLTYSRRFSRVSCIDNCN